MPLPAASRIARRFVSVCSVCSWIESLTGCGLSGVIPTCPATKTKPFALIAWEYGAPWNGAGAPSVRMTSFTAPPSSAVGTPGRVRRPAP